MARLILSVRRCICCVHDKSEHCRKGEIGLWLLWKPTGSHHRATQWTHLQPPTTTTSPKLGLTTSVKTCIVNCSQMVPDTTVVCTDSLWEHTIASGWITEVPRGPGPLKDWVAVVTHVCVVMWVGQYKLHLSQPQAVKPNNTPLCLQATWSTQRPSGWYQTVENEIGTTNTTGCRSSSDAVMLATLTLATENTHCQLPYIQYTWAIYSSSFTDLLLLISEISVTEWLQKKK